MEEVYAWIAESDENLGLFREFKRIWDLAEYGIRYPESPSVDLEWELLRNRLDQVPRVLELFPLKQTSNQRLHSFSATFMRYAAILIFTTLMSFFFVQEYYQSIEMIVQEPVLREISTSRAERGSVMLSDGTRIVVNSESTLRIPNHFGVDKREIFLQGEAFFDVAKDPNRSFMIHVNGATIEVLGTRFAVKSYPEEDEVQTVVEEGVVAIHSLEAGLTDRVMLTRGMVANLDLAKQEIVTRSLKDLAGFLSWKEGFLTFDQTPMAEVARQLERKYDVDVLFASEDIEEMKLTAVLKSRSITNVLSVISTSLGLSATLEEDRVLFDHVKLYKDGKPSGIGTMIETVVTEE